MFCIEMWKNHQLCILRVSARTVCYVSVCLCNITSARIRKPPSQQVPAKSGLFDRYSAYVDCYMVIGYKVYSESIVTLWNGWSPLQQCSATCSIWCVLSLQLHV